MSARTSEPARSVGLPFATVLAVLALGLLVGLLGPPARGEPAPATTAWTQAQVAAARRWIESGAAREGGTRPFADAERGDWHYVPRRRAGVAFGRMTAPQRHAALALVRAGLSPTGAAQTEGVMALESVLGQMERNRGRDPFDYALTIFGTPGQAPWGWRLEGHHVSWNVTVAAPDVVSMTPCFVGTNPARVPAGPSAGQRLQARELDLGLALAQSLDEAQWRAALLDVRTPGDVITGPGRAAALAAPQGLSAAALRPEQQALLLELVTVYVGRTPEEFARAYLEQVRAGLAETRWAWAGSRTAGQPCYYRIHGPRVLIELDNTQNQANHVHTVWRDPVNDFGRSDLRAHHASGAHTDLRGR